MGFLLGALGAPWAPKGPSLASFWSPFGSLGTPWGHLGHPGLPRGAWDDFGSKMDSNSEQMALKWRACAQKVTSRNSATSATNGPKVAQEPQLPTPLHSRRGPVSAGLCLLAPISPLGMLVDPFGCLWNSFCFPWGDFGLPFGSLWGALGFQGALLGVTLVPLWLGPPWGHLGHLGLPRGA